MKKIRNYHELMDALKGIINDKDSSKNDKIFATGMAYLVADYIPKDRTTRFVLHDRRPKKESEDEN